MLFRDTRGPLILQVLLTVLAARWFAGAEEPILALGLADNGTAAAVTDRGPQRKRTLHLGTVYAGRDVSARVSFVNACKESIVLGSPKFSCPCPFKVRYQLNGAAEPQEPPLEVASGERGQLLINAGTLGAAPCFRTSIAIPSQDGSRILGEIEVFYQVSDMFVFWPAEVNLGASDEAREGSQLLHVRNLFTKMPLTFAAKVPRSLAADLRVEPILSESGFNILKITWQAGAATKLRSGVEEFLIVEPHNEFLDKDFPGKFTLPIPLIDRGRVESLSVTPSYKVLKLDSDADYDEVSVFTIISEDKPFTARTLDYNADALRVAWFQESPNFFNLLVRPERQKFTLSHSVRRESITIYVDGQDPLVIPLFLEHTQSSRVGGEVKALKGAEKVSEKKVVQPKP